jgi:glycosyltransferase involved in cell wall biosynthesis
VNVTVITTAESGGMLHYCAQLSNALIRAVDVSVVVDERADASLFDDGVAVEKIRFPHSKSELGPRLPALWPRIYRRLAAPEVDVVHATILDPLLVPPLLALREKRTVYTLHDVSDHPGDEKLRNDVTRRLLNRGVDRVVVHGEHNARRYRERFGGGNELVRSSHGEYSFFRDCCDSPVRYERELLFFGRIRPYKGVETLLSAAEEVTNAVDDYRLTVAGSGPLDIDGNLDDHVTVRNEFLSNEAVCELFSRCRAVVLPYREASQSGVVPIAYAFRKPVVATAVGGLPEVIEDGSTGYLVEPDSPGPLADRCVSLLRDESKARTFGERGFAFAREHMNWDRIVDGLIAEAYAD